MPATMKNKATPKLPEDCPTDSRTGRRLEDIKQSFLDNLFYGMGRAPMAATRNDVYTALALAIRDRVLKKGVQTLETYAVNDARMVAYMSAEFLPGPHLANNLLNLGMTELVREAMAQLAIDLEDVLEQEDEPGLGNGGLGRLASCYMDSLASLEVPAIGYGIRYEFGIFDQVIRDGWQVEVTDKWLRLGNPWEIARPELAFDVKFGGHTETYTDKQGNYRVRWEPETVVKGVAYDTPILGYKVGTCNRLRLWKAEAVESFDFSAFNHGDYYRAVEEKISSENITKVLYPNDLAVQGKTLRLKQQFFFASCSLQDMIRVHLVLGRRLEQFHEKFAVQLNDTHPSIAVAELMRLLIDEHHLDWNTAWYVTSHTFSYTNHTLMPEALEKWSLSLLGKLLPRHLEIIYEINRRFLNEVLAKFPGDDARLSRMSLIDEDGERYVRMAHLAVVGSHHVNGVARMHSELLKTLVMKDFAEMWPQKFCNVTNGVTPRRFVAVSNPELTLLISSRIGDGWLRDLDQLRKLETFADDAEFHKLWREVKLTAKRRLASIVEQRTGVKIEPDTLFDIQTKRIHEYKRQHLNVLHILTRYLSLKKNPHDDMPARTFIIGGKAAPGYTMAKLIIKLVNAVGELINNDPDVRGRLKVAFFPDFNVKNAQHIYPAADLSEQISTAGKEASGTGNMKFQMNGALTIGTVDGANIEISEEVGVENFFLFGLEAHEVVAKRAMGYRPMEVVETNDELRAVIDLIRDGFFSRGNSSQFQPLIDNLLHHDPYFVLADYQSYADCQAQVDSAYRDVDRWTRMSILNSARSGKFSSDRTIREYCNDIWKVKPVQVQLMSQEDVKAGLLQ